MIRSVLLSAALVALGFSIECRLGHFSSSDGSKCFDVVKVSASFVDAAKTCAHFGGKLAAIGALDQKLVKEHLFNEVDLINNFWISGVEQKCDVLNAKFDKTFEVDCGTKNFYVCENSGERVELRSATRTPSSPSCPKGWEQFEDSCFLVNINSQNQEDAKEFCKENGADLVSIHSTEENDFVSLLYVTKGGEGNFWLGAERSNPQDAYAWSDGSAFTYQNWGQGQPDKYNLCSMWDIYTKTWYSPYCSYSGGAVCKKLRVPKPTVFCPEECRVQTTCPTAGTTKAPLPEKCLLGWRQYGNGCYLVNAKEMKWMAAENFCVSKDAHLASIHSLSENRFIGDLLTEKGIWHFTWIGGIRNSTSEGFRWTDGSNWDYTKWLNTKQKGHVGPIEYFPAGRTWSIPILDLKESISPSVCKQNLRAKN
ncbi:hypothetical protein L596_023939 [Steinernema carpocapsae]|uniref:C-type lectin domain-containing protein n=1 Tax=Steinernema carpocapsae TaxID=34508 RepID=A0A4V5ZZJ8_STECR|nr:hypothetical protein L596_023939 [Steinernema carpocapsae]